MQVPVDHQFTLDTLPIEESSIKVTPQSNYLFDPVTREIIVSTSGVDSVNVCYRTLNEGVYQPVYQRSIDTYALQGSNVKPGLSTPLVKDEIFQFGGVESFGAITRGISFGNRQNLFVNSALNLQMEGALTEDLKVSAMITDQNIPYQPEGNTQQISDFDNVFIKLYNDNFELIAGDVVLQNPVEESYFLRYYKNVQGLSLKYDYNLGEKWKATSMVSGAAAKGQFASTQVQPIENVQGPYKLRGPNGERFIIVMANSERVFLDGVLMERGFDRDYVIDYNLGEVTFSNTVIITRFTRIRIDFEYAEQFYGRSNISLNQQLASDKMKFYLNYYREKDNPNSNLGFSLDQDDLDQLAEAGNTRKGGLISGVDSVGFIENSLLYERKDTLDQDGTVQTIYAYSNDPQDAQFQVSFTEVGDGNGDYLLANVQANGRVYQWVSRQNGTKQGRFDPIIQIPTPNKKEMLVGGAVIEISPHEKVFQETAFSVTDRNLYSTLDDEDNRGVAFKGGISSKRPVSFLPEYQFQGLVSYEYNQARFNPIDRFRSIEFDRDWNYNVFADTIGRADRIFTLQGGVKKDHNNLLDYQLSYRNREDVVDGTQQRLNLSKKLGLIHVRSENYLLENAYGNVTSGWIRSTNDVRLSTGWLNPGYQFTLDHNTSSVTDSVFNTLMYYHAHTAYLTTSDSLKTRMRLDYTKRYDQLPVDGVLRDYTEADEIKFGIATSIGAGQKISAQLNYRTVNDLILGERQGNLVGKLDWMTDFFDGLVKRQLTFSTANTRELKREFIFITVPTGNGTHTWRDENGDGIQDLDEFYEAINVDERNYIKLFSPTDEYLEAYQTTFLQTLDVRLPTAWQKGGGFLSTISKFSFNANVRMNFKTTSENIYRRLVPVFLRLDSDHYIFARTQQRFSLFYNRNAPGFGFDVNNTIQNNKSLLSNGYELRGNNIWLSNFRLSANAQYTVRLKAAMGKQTNETDFFESRNFLLQLRSISPEFVWQPINQLRVLVNWESRTKRNIEGEMGEYTNINEYGAEVTWLKVGKGSLNTLLQWLEIDFEGEENSYLGYELLEALRPGSNQKWSINWQQSLGRGLQLNLQYLGRKSTGNSAVHTGTAQLTAYF